MHMTASAAVAGEKNVSKFTYYLTRKGPGFVLKLEGRFFQEEAAAFDEQIDKIFDGKPEQLLVDMSGVDAISSAGLGTLIKLQKCADKNQCGMRVTAMRESIETIVRLCRLDQVLTIS